MRVLNENPKISDELVTQLTSNYNKFIRNRMQRMYNRELNHQRTRADYDAVLRVVKHDELDKGAVGEFTTQPSSLPQTDEGGVIKQHLNTDAVLTGQDLNDHMLYYSNRCDLYELQIAELFKHFDDLYQQHLHLQGEHLRVMEQLEEVNS